METIISYILISKKLSFQSFQIYIYIYSILNFSILSTKHIWLKIEFLKQRKKKNKDWKLRIFHSPTFVSFLHFLSSQSLNQMNLKFLYSTLIRTSLFGHLYSDSRTKSHSLYTHWAPSSLFLCLMHKNKIPYIVWHNNNFLETKFSILSIISSQQNKRNLYLFSIIPPFHVIYKTHMI